MLIERSHIMSRIVNSSTNLTIQSHTMLIAESTHLVWYSCYVINKFVMIACGLLTSRPICSQRLLYNFCKRRLERGEAERKSMNVTHPSTLPIFLAYVIRSSNLIFLVQKRRTLIRIIIHFDTEEWFSLVVNANSRREMNLFTKFSRSKSIKSFVLHSSVSQLRNGSVTNVEPFCRVHLYVISNKRPWNGS